MYFLSSTFALLAAVGVRALQSPHERAAKFSKRSFTPLYTRDATKSNPTTLFLNEKTKKFAVNGSALPDVDFNIGESYAGLLPISSNSSDENQLWFWFFPSQNSHAKKEIGIWLNGGPGCSSLDGLLQENGPFLWQSGTFQPIRNPYAFTNLTNMVWIDQPITTGFSRGTKIVNNETDVTTDFMGFWKNFIDTFSMKGYEIYILGESYAGQYIPYIASGMLDAKDHDYFNVKGVQINDPLINVDDVMIVTPVVPALHEYNNVLNMNESYLADITARAGTCGYTDFFNKHTTEFPPSGLIPAAPSSGKPGCDLHNDIVSALVRVNPCFNIYHLTDFCPYLWDQLEFPSLAGPDNDFNRNYFNRSDVQAQLNVPPTNFYICARGDNLFPDGDESVPSALGPLPSVIERTNKTIIGHGLLDFLLFANGSLITIQNMTWNGLQGFQTAPSKTQNLYVPYHQSLGTILGLDDNAVPDVTPQYDTAGAGWQGTWHTERGLTLAIVNLAGHQIPQYVPGASYRQLEFLLGRIENLGVIGDYTTQKGNFIGRSTAVEEGLGE